MQMMIWLVILIKIQEMNIAHYKVVVLGEGRVGKTSISLKYVNNEFSDKTKRTINATYLQKKIKLESEKSIKLSIWDTAGQEEYNSVAPIYYKDAAGAIIVYDITSRESFDKVKKWVTELEQNAPKDIVLTIAGNKADLEGSRRVQKQEVEAFAKRHSAQHFTVSAKNGSNVAEMFQNLAERVYAAGSQQEKMVSSKRSGPKLTVDRVEKKAKSKDEGCC